MAYYVFGAIFAVTAFSLILCSNLTNTTFLRLYKADCCEQQQPRTQEQTQQHSQDSVIKQHMQQRAPPAESPPEEDVGEDGPEEKRRHDPEGSSEVQQSSTDKDEPAEIGAPTTTVSAREESSLENGVVRQQQQDLAQLRTLQTMFNVNATGTMSSCGLDTNNGSHTIRTTLVVAPTDAERIHLLEEICRRWTDPIVAVVAIASTADEERSRQVRVEVCPQLTLKLEAVEQSQLTDSDFPINRLRNVGLDAVRTSHVLVVDADFLPSRHLEDRIRSALRSRQEIRLEEEDALVVPAFERLPSVTSSPTTNNTNDDNKNNSNNNNSLSIPRTFSELQQCYKVKDCRAVGGDRSKMLHASTRSESWLRRVWYEEYDEQPIVLGKTPSGGKGNQHQEVSKTIRTIQCIDTDKKFTYRYQPFVVVRWCPEKTPLPAGTVYAVAAEKTVDDGDGFMSLQNQPVSPYFDERFRGTGKNRLAWVSHLRMMGYQFPILPEGFVVRDMSVGTPPVQQQHTEQEQTDASEGVQRMRMDVLYTNFTEELSDMYDNLKDSVVPICGKVDKKFKPVFTNYTLVDGPSSNPASVTRYRVIGSSKYPPRYLKNVAAYSNSSNCTTVIPDEDIRTTLVFQCSLDRLWILEKTCERWSDPIVTVVSLTVDEQAVDGDPIGESLASWNTLCPQLTVIEYKLDAKQSRPEMYPVNVLRNAGLDAVRTSHVVVADVDFVPSENLPETIRSVLKERRQFRIENEQRGDAAIGMAPEEQEALVIPAFERVVYKGTNVQCRSDDDCSQFKKSSSFIPKTFMQLKSCSMKKYCRQFNWFNNKAGHSATKQDDWLKGQWYSNDSPDGRSAGNGAARNIRFIK